MAQLSEEYFDNGLTDVFSVIAPSCLVPLQNLIYTNLKSLLIDHDNDQPLLERLRLPFKRPPTPDELSAFMRSIDGSREVKDIVESAEIKEAFTKVFGSSSVTPFPISRFRAQFPNIGRSTYNWHQDEGTWYAVPVKDLAHKMPATLWLSVNGADSTNSIELIPNSHKSKLEKHTVVEGQGYFNAAVPKYMRDWPTKVISAAAGQGVAFHPLTFHRSVVNQMLTPRFSIDIRYYCEENCNSKYGVNLQFWLKRTMTKGHRMAG